MSRLHKIIYRISVLAEAVITEIEDLETQSGYKHDLKQRVKAFKGVIEKYTFRNPDKTVFKNKEYLTKRELMYLRIEQALAELSGNEEKLNAFTDEIEQTTKKYNPF